jgi:hydroxyacylglutathione hydrolase
LTLQIHTIPAFNDNYFWLFHRQGDARAYVVDPGDAAPVQHALKQFNLTLTGILITHHHSDHVGGIDALLSQQAVPVFGPAGGRVAQVTHPLADFESLQLNIGLQFTVFEVPGHTLDHIAYFAEPQGEDPLVFCGDTLFAGGCGRLFEGSAEQMHRSLSRLAALPTNTRVFCAPESTLANLAFARAVEPANADLVKRIEVEKRRREQKIPTVPSTILLERQTNPFMRSGEAAVKTAAEQFQQQSLASEAQVLAAIRRWKDNF